MRRAPRSAADGRERLLGRAPRSPRGRRAPAMRSATSPRRPSEELGDRRRTPPPSVACSHDLAQRQEGDPLAVRRGTVPTSTSRLVADGAEQLLREPRLADAGGAEQREEDEGPLAHCARASAPPQLLRARARGRRAASRAARSKAARPRRARRAATPAAAASGRAARRARSPRRAPLPARGAASRRVSRISPGRCRRARAARRARRLARRRDAAPSPAMTSPVWTRDRGGERGPELDVERGNAVAELGRRARRPGARRPRARAERRRRRACRRRPRSPPSPPWRSIAATPRRRRLRETRRPDLRVERSASTAGLGERRRGAR